MIRLDATTKSLELIMLAAPTTQPAFYASWSEQSATAYGGKSNAGAANGVTAVTLVPAPASGVTSDIDDLHIHNADAASQTIVVRLNTSGVFVTLFKAILASLDTLIYTHGQGWRVIDSTGNVKTSGTGGGGSGGGGATGGAGDQVFYENDIYVAHDYTITAGNNAMSAGPITINNGITVTVPNGSVWSII